MKKAKIGCIGILAAVGALSLLLMLFNWFAFDFRDVSPMQDYVYEDEVYTESFEAPSSGFIEGKALDRNLAVDGDDFGNTSVQATPGSQDRMVIKNANLSIKVKSVEDQTQQIQDMVVAKGGFISSSNSYISGMKEALVTSMTLKVPSDAFDETVQEIKKLALKVVSERLGGQDVTDEYVDLTSRLKNLEVTHDQLMTIMQKAVKIPEILEVQRELTNVTEQIEVLKGRMQYLEKSTDMATITVNLSTEEKELPLVEEGWDPLRTAKLALKSLIKVVTRLGDLAIWLVVFVGPFVLVLVLVLVILARFGKRLIEKKKQKNK